MSKRKGSNHPGHYIPDRGPNGERPIVPSHMFPGAAPMCECGYHKGWHFTGDDMACQIEGANCLGFTEVKDPSIVQRLLKAVRGN